MFLIQWAVMLLTGTNLSEKPNQCPIPGGNYRDFCDPGNVVKLDDSTCVLQTLCYDGYSHYGHHYDANYYYPAYTKPDLTTYQNTILSASIELPPSSTCADYLSECELQYDNKGELSSFENSCSSGWNKMEISKVTDTLCMAKTVCTGARKYADPNNVTAFRSNAIFYPPGTRFKKIENVAGMLSVQAAQNVELSIYHGRPRNRDNAASENAAMVCEPPALYWRPYEYIKSWIYQAPKSKQPPTHDCSGNAHLLLAAPVLLLLH